jgi:hypothetical protein
VRGCPLFIWRRVGHWYSIKNGDILSNKEYSMQNMTVTITDDSKVETLFSLLRDLRYVQVTVNTLAKKKRRNFFSKTIKPDTFTMYARDELHD